jgi:hypothetical protein
MQLKVTNLIILPCYANLFLSGKEALALGSKKYFYLFITIYIGSDSGEKTGYYAK